jgi:uncharacterized protein
MQIWVDADACPKVIKDILFRAAERLAMPVILVANKPLHTPPSPHIRSMVVAAGFDMADNRMIARGAHALNPRGELYTRENIRERLNMRDFMDQLRSTGVQTGGPSMLSHSDRQAFANQLDRFLNRLAKKA